MPTFVYRPDDPDADEFGMIEKAARMTAGAPSVIGDEMDALRHMANGKMYTSKAKFREATREAGCVEIGNENVVRRRKPVLLDRRQRRDDIRRAIHDLKNGNAPTIQQILSGEER